MPYTDYVQMKNDHKEELDAFPIKFAFCEKQFDEAMHELGLEKDEYDKIYSVGNYGFYRRTDAKALREILERHERDMDEALTADNTGDGFIYTMFLYELHSHEYGYTMSTEQTLETLDITDDDLKNNEALNHGLHKAMKTIKKEEGYE